MEFYIPTSQMPAVGGNYSDNAMSETNFMTEALQTSIDRLEIWDADTIMDYSYVSSSPQFFFLEELLKFDSEAFQYLLYNSCQRVIPSWEFNCDNTNLRPQLFALKRFILGQISRETLKDGNKKIASGKFDCSYSDTSSAANTLFNATNAILESSTLYASYALSDAQIANTTKDWQFKKWLSEVAIPLSLNKAFCNYDQTTYLTYDEYREHYKDLFFELGNCK